MTNPKRLELALERIAPAEWQMFERFASSFLVGEFANLRTMAAPGGDGGRDAELFAPDGDVTVVLQYSVTANWREKIRQTVKRLNEVASPYVQLIYVTNQQIGADADELRAEVRKGHGKILDIRDRSYFLERFQQDAKRERAAEDLAKAIVDPLLAGRGIIQNKGRALTPGEGRAALVFLELQWQDDSRDKGLTKTAFDALVRSALRDTNSENPKHLAEIYQAVCTMLPEHERDFVLRETDKALRRLDKKYIRTYQKDEMYCLTHEESERIQARLLELEIADGELKREVAEAMTNVAGSDMSLFGALDVAQEVCMSVVEKFLMDRGELFVSAFTSNNMVSLGFEGFVAIVDSELSKLGLKSSSGERARSIVATVVERLLSTPTEAVSRYLRVLSDAYTLRAFLRQTPDIQRAVQKMFSAGEIWLDASMILPLFAEEAAPKSDRSFRRLIAAACSAGLSLKVTPGIIEEVERHMNRAKLCSVTPATGWHGSIPYILSVYAARGHNIHRFSDFLTKFRGDARPEDDIADYLSREFGVARVEIAEDAQKAQESLRYTVKEIWREIHHIRRGRGVDYDEMLTNRLAEHDAENFLGVMTRRKEDLPSAVGYTSWWLTLDQRAFGVMDDVNRRINARYRSPVMSADFLANYLAVGPLRDKAAEYAEGIPIALDVTRFESMSSELFQLANSVREKSAGMDEHLIRRMVRDEVDRAKMRTGELTAEGLVC